MEDKLKSVVDNRDLLDMQDRYDIYNSASEVSMLSLNDNIQIKYLFKNSTIDEVKRFYDILKNQQSTTAIYLLSGSVNPKIKVVEVNTSQQIGNEILKFSETSNDNKLINHDKHLGSLILREEWKRQATNLNSSGTNSR